MNTYMAKDQIASEIVADEPTIEEDEAKKGAIDKAKASVVEQIVKADDQVAKADEQVAEANEQAVDETGVKEKCS